MGKWLAHNSKAATTAPCVWRLRVRRRLREERNNMGSVQKAAYRLAFSVITFVDDFQRVRRPREKLDVFVHCQLDVFQWVSLRAFFFGDCEFEFARPERMKSCT